MKLYPLRQPLEGERVLEVQPELGPDSQVGWRRRPRMFNGRSLSDIALSIEQESRAGHLATRGQWMAPGVVSGLEVVVERPPEGPAVLYVNKGYGLTAAGEDVMVPWPLQVKLEELPVYAPPQILDGSASEGDRVSGAASVRRVGDSLTRVREVWAERNQPALLAGFLVAQPVVVETRESPDEDACDDDPSDYAFEDWQLLDGCRLLFCTWPTEVVSLPVPGTQWRNRLAYEVFRLESASAAVGMPWAEVGVPIAMLGFDPAGALLFVDRFSVVRAGGQSRHTARTLPGTGSPVLWQARIQQFAEHLGDPELISLPAGEVAGHFRYLPPAGLLPKDALNLGTRLSSFFPPGYELTAAPVPAEQLDVALIPSAGTQPFDLFTADALEILVPVPQTLFEPGLLLTETVDAEFQESIQEFALRRGRWLNRRLNVRAKASVLNKAIMGEPLVFPDLDPGQVEEEEIAPDPIDPDDPLLQTHELPYGTSAPADELIVVAFENLKATLRDNTPVKSETREPLPSLPVQIPIPLQGKIVHTSGNLVVKGVLTDSERTNLANLDQNTTSPFRIAVERLHVRSQDDELTQLDKLGLEEFIKFLQLKINQSDDTLDLGFLMTQASMYRLRQIILGTDAASRLATSPALATIASGSTAAATKQNIADFFASAKTVSGPVETVAAPEAAPAVSEEAPPAATIEEAPPAGARGFVATAPLGGTRVTDFLSSSPTIDLLGGSLLGGFIPRVEEPTLAFETSLGPQLLYRGLDLKDEIAGQSPIPEAYDFRTVTIAERLMSPPAIEAKSYAVDSKFEVFDGATKIPIDIDDLEVPGFRDDAGNDIKLNFAAIKAGGLAGAIQRGDYDPNPADGDEAAFLSAGVKALDSSIGTLRIIEGRVQAYKRALALCRKALAEITALKAQSVQRLHEIESNLAEARHDVAVARALLAEETKRVDGINSRRTRVLADNVTFLAYRRPRTVDTLADLPARTVDPGLTTQPVPACLDDDEAVPGELKGLVELIKDAPVNWFTHVPRILDGLNQVQDLHLALSGAKLQAELAIQKPLAVSLTSGVYSAALAQTLNAQHQVLAQQKSVKAGIDLGRLTSLTWVGVVAEAQRVLTLRDLIEGPHGKAGVSQRAAAELANITSVATCLYHRFGEVLPAIRLVWAERLSQFDRGVGLRNLAALPRWGEIEFQDRREAQIFVDWLYERVDRNRPEAVGLVDTIVRVCLLLASHAPVNQLVTGRVRKPVVARPGVKIDVSVLTAQLPKLSIGMQAHIYSGPTVVATAVVQDLASGVVTAQVIQTAAPTVAIEVDANVHFATAGSSAALGLGKAVKQF